MTTPTADTTALEDALTTRFLRYSAISSQSQAEETTLPTSPGQMELARLLRDELTAAGASNVHLTEHAVLTATIPSTLPAEHPPVPAVGFCTHLDTVDAGLSPVVKARVHAYTGGDILLNPELDIWLTTTENPEITAYTGQRILVTDGTSVLGADDKAGVATVMEAACTLLADPSIPHGDIHLSFVPDEEIGLRGVRAMDLTRFPADYAYTLDCCQLGEVVAETFNAATATLTIHGVTAHPMSAKGILLNPILIANDFISRLDPLQTPEHTEGREGYTWVNAMTANQATATLTISIRDHDRTGYTARKQQLEDIITELRTAYPRASFTLDIEDVYTNIADARTDTNAGALANIYTALDNLGIEPINLAMRGGTDGSWLSEQGIFTPNIFTGAHNFHSRNEFLPLPSFAQSYLLVQELIRLAAEGK